ncbi:hypothetical protein ADIARSV_1080 [Arcticibacter svalbardensis MN12-7]|uniref:Uncharacterized protein n=1 Tax=Arcticibacter svalbardensis MN12-7 TaxID=1150600 RepID=R9GVA2_9SPHI|nr:hypothetical protein ADIARSV_1080 [Arcticibacter svalbardensis MN12-7]
MQKEPGLAVQELTYLMSKFGVNYLKEHGVEYQKDQQLYR